LNAVQPGLDGAQGGSRCQTRVRVIAPRRNMHRSRPRNTGQEKTQEPKRPTDTYQYDLYLL